MSINILSLLVFVAGFLTLILFIFALSRKHSTLNLLFAFYGLGGSIYAFGYGFELLSSNLAQILFWSKIQYIGISFSPAVIMLIVIHYTGKGKVINIFRTFLMFCIPVVTFLSRMTNQYHHLFYREASIEPSIYGNLLNIVPGPLYYIHIVFLNAAWIFSFIWLLRYRKQALFLYRRQSLFMILAISTQWMALFIYITGAGPRNVDLNPFLLPITSIFFSIGIFRYSLFDLAPLARDKLFEVMTESILVVDSEMRLADYNKKIINIFPEIKDNLGENIGDILGSYTEILDLFMNDEVNNREIKLVIDKKIKYYTISLFSLLNEKNQVIGKIVSLNDISNLKELAAIDSMTGIFNRRELLSRIDLELRRLKRTKRILSLLIFNIDHFSQINEEHGYQCGDEVLKQITRTIKMSIREIDILGRYSNDEFLLLLPETDEEQTSIIASRITENVAENPVLFHDKEIKCSVSFGIFGTSAEENQDLDALLKLTTQNLIKAKKD